MTELKTANQIVDKYRQACGLNIGFRLTPFLLVLGFAFPLVLGFASGVFLTVVFNFVF